MNSSLSLSFREQGWLLEREVENKFLSYYQVESAYNKTAQYVPICFYYYSIIRYFLLPMLKRV